jgi:hypothetical protein
MRPALRALDTAELVATAAPPLAALRRGAGRKADGPCSTYAWPVATRTYSCPRRASCALSASERTTHDSTPSRVDRVPWNSGIAWAD